MKTLSYSIRSLVLIFAVGSTALCAQSCAATGNFANASAHAVNASGEVLASGAASVAGSAQAASAVVAVPVWVAGSAVAGSGAVSTAVGETASKAGTAMTHGAGKLWDFASGDASERPTLDRARSVPPAPAPTAKAKDPSPAEALKRL